MVLGSIILRRLVTLQTDAVAWGSQHQAVWLVTITAGDTRLIHLALQEGTVDVHLVINLAVGEIHAVIKAPRHVVIHKSLTMHIVTGNRATSRMTAGAHLDLFITDSRLAALRVSCVQIQNPSNAFAFVKQQPQACVAIKLLPTWHFFRPEHVIRSGPMTGLAGDINL